MSSWLLLVWLWNFLNIDLNKNNFKIIFHNNIKMSLFGNQIKDQFEIEPGYTNVNHASFG